jgi:hypothetical protein
MTSPPLGIFKSAPTRRTHYVRQFMMSPWSHESLVDSLDAGLSFSDCRSEEELSLRYHYVGGCMRNLVQSTEHCAALANKVVDDIEESGDSNQFLSE